MNALQILRERGLLADSTPDLEAWLSAAPRSFYVGWDCTATSLHAGSLALIMCMAHLQRAGHRPIVLMGSGTTRIGDPTGRSTERKLLSGQEIEVNKRALQAQLERYLDLSGGLVVDNGDWLLGLNYVDFLRDVGSHVPVSQMLARTSVKERLKKGMSFLEFNYALFQAYDFLHLSQAEDCLVQVGGADQWGNITAGVDLIRRVTQRDAHAMTIPLVTTADGKKMGKSAAGAIWLDPAQTSPYDWYQYWINVDDRDVGRYLRIFTWLPLDEIAALEALTGSDVRQAKRVLAFEATRLCHGDRAAREAQAGARAAFGGGAAVEKMPAFEAALPMGVIDALTLSKLCGTRSDARRQIQGGAIKVNGVKVTEIEAQLTEDLLGEDGALVLSRGKKKRLRVTAAPT